MLGPLSLNVTDWLRGQTEIAANSGSISSRDYCLVNECFLLSPVSQPWCVHLCWGLSFPRVFIDRSYLPREEPPHSPAFYRYQQQWLPCMCVGMNCVQRVPGPCLFYLVWRVVALQNKRPRVEGPPLQVGIVVYFYLGVEVAVVEASAAPFSTAAFQFAVTSCSFTWKSIRWI